MLDRNEKERSRLMFFTQIRVIDNRFVGFSPTVVFVGFARFIVRSHVVSQSHREYISLADSVNAM